MSVWHDIALRCDGCQDIRTLNVYSERPLEPKMQYTTQFGCTVCGNKCGVIIGVEPA